MKISHTLIHNSIAYGILEGTKVPEKPFPKSQCYHPNCDPPKYCDCDKQEKQYAIDILSVSIRWEDQWQTRRFLPKHAFKYADGTDEMLVDGIYPLEGVNADPVWQAKHVFDKTWKDDPEQKDAGYFDFQGRQVLRLIPQPNSEQKTDEERGMPHLTHGVLDEFMVEGTEVSEPLIHNLETTSATSWTKDGDKETFGVDEMKEPETPKCSDCERRLTLVRPGKYQCDNPHCSGGVSEEEPTDLWTELITEIQRMEVVDAIDYAKSKYHIQKLKP